ncbi:hypothetical protein J7337_007749 [Fusarium musae]|uniref:Uncharacterized protein n=1 Tax=Fusarium musae TaxID=1042133 RepID=A0A9P8DHL8_9HYPO|nr:hypothetical protein J7337_007749 [Fusarium musae]KAG9502038.1 hypothetical protein J7337_007749 [Fusarium musae]
MHPGYYTIAPLRLEKSQCSPKDPPKSIHLSVHLADTRGWSKRPKIENLKEKTDDDKPEDEKPNGKSDGDHDTGSGDTEAAKLGKFQATVENSENCGNENEEGEDDEGGSDDKAKAKKSWFFGFAFFGTVLITKVPHANVPLDVNYMIARDFVAVDKVKKKEDDKEGDADGDDEGGEGDAKEQAIKTMDESPKGDDKEGKETDKKNDKSKHKRSWNLLIKPDK